MEQVSSSDELVLFCVDRARDETHASLPLEGDVSSCPGFIGKGKSATLQGVEGCC